MALPPIENTPKQKHYDVVIIGGAIVGSSIAWHLTANSDFNGSVLVVERDPTYEFASTTHTNSCIRQQFSMELNIRISQYGVHFIKNFREIMGGDPEVPEIALHDYGYLYLAGTQDFADYLTECQKLQSSLGAGTRIMTPDQIAEEYPFYNLDGVVLGSHNPLDEGYFDGHTIFDWLRRMARRNGIEYVTNEVTGVQRDGDTVTSVTLKSGETIGCGIAVNASGPRAAVTAQMAGLDVPVEPRRRYTFVFDAEEPLEKDLPLTIDPTGVHMRSDGQYYLCGCPPDDDPAVAFDDFEADHSIWEEKVWPAIANRVPAFERVKMTSYWIGHYAFNTLDQNAIVGAHPEVRNFIFANGFSGHGLQQSPAVGRAVSEWIAHGAYQTLDFTPLGIERILEGRPIIEKAVI